MPELASRILSWRFGFGFDRRAEKILDFRLTRYPNFGRLDASPVNLVESAGSPRIVPAAIRDRLDSPDRASA
jgi:hypothetical protein